MKQKIWKLRRDYEKLIISVILMLQPYIMMNLNNYRDPQIVRQIVDSLADYDKTVKIMEVCGTHTMALGKWGIRDLLPKNIKLLSGPGCPVCVASPDLIDSLICLEKDVIIATFGDLLRVPGSLGTLEQAQAKGADIRIIYSPLELFELAKKKETIFVGIGFETTIPGIAYITLEAKKNNLTNLSILPHFKLIPPALKALISDEQVEIDAFILPGHVSIITGVEAYSFLPEKYNIGGVVAGFEPVDILLAIKKLLEQMDHPRIFNEYSRVVTKSGNKHAKLIMNKVFAVTGALWRGLGWISNSGLEMQQEFSMFDATKKYDLKYGINDRFKDNINVDTGTSFHTNANPINDKCRCNDVLKGKIIPLECSLFDKVCSPYNPIGPCMVSSEGSCAAYHRYEIKGNKQNRNNI